MNCYEISAETANKQDPSGFIGGTPSLPAGSEWPTCGLCQADLVHFLDVEMPKASDPFLTGSRLQIFACLAHDDIAGTIYSNYRNFDEVSRSARLPNGFWQVSDGHYLIRLLPPGTAVVASRHEKNLALQNLRLLAATDSEADPKSSFKLFGFPSWAQFAENHTCCCGAPMQLLLQIPALFGFDMASGAPPQPNSFSEKQYCLFLGNELYLLGCTRQCHPQALFPVLQH